MPRLKLTIAYVGTQYHGWQTQARKNASPLPTIQNIIEDAVAHVLGERVHVHGAGRTDAGVHAEAAGRSPRCPRIACPYGLAAGPQYAPAARHTACGRRSCPDTFHAQHSAVRKDLRIPPLALQALHAAAALSFVWACGPVDVERMDEGSRYLLGKRDFASLKNAGTDLRTTVRTILSITRTPEGPLPEGCLELTWRFEADGFLKQMVRNTMGLLVAVGRGKLEPADIPGILDACDRRIAPLTAPACGLTMKKVWYDDMFPLAASGHEGA